MPENLERNQLRKPRSIACGCVVLAVFLIAITAYQLRDREPRLLARSRIIPVTLQSPGDYYWLSSQKLLALLPTKTGFAASIIDVTNRSGSPLQALSSQLTGASSIIKPVLSPNRKWLLFQQSGTGTRQDVAVSVDGSRQISWPLAEGVGTNGWVWYPPIWLADSHSWLEITPADSDDRNSLIRHGMGKGESDRDLGKWDSVGDVLGQDISGRLVIYRVEESLRIKHSLSSYDPNSRTQTGEIVVPTDSHRTLEQIRLSPNHEQVAFVTATGGGPIFSIWGLDAIIPSLWSYRRPRKERLWVYGVDGKGMHELGCTLDKEGPYEITDLKWLPDGKSLSFVLDGRLWVTPAE